MKCGACVVGLVLCSMSSLALASEAAPAELFAAGTRALERGAPEEAIDQFELLADRGFVHPDASYNRAAAYVARARSNTPRPGDLGRAAAALSETLELRPEDADAARALERVRAEISRRRARAGADPVIAKPSLLRAFVGYFDENVYGAIALLGSLLLAVGLSMHTFAKASRVRLSAATAAWIGGGLLVLGAGLAETARRLRTNAEPAVIVVTESRLLDENGTPLTGKRVEHAAIPEGASVLVRERHGRLARVEWGTTEGFVQSSDLRVLHRPDS
jgi:hypothetical protein